jgi:hypothetical protein
VNRARVKSVFARAIALDPEARAAFLREACEGNEALHGEVSSLLGFHDERELIAEPAPSPVVGGESLAPGSMVGEYRIENLLGAGGSGSRSR